jgi:hypothetical protein
MPLDFTPAQEAALASDLAARAGTAPAPVKPTELPIDNAIAGKDANRTNMIEALREQGLHKDHEAFLADPHPPKFSREAYDTAVLNKAMWLKDKAWQQRYLDGGRQERSDMLATSIVLAIGFDPSK